MTACIICPSNAHSAYSVAAKEFASMAKRVASVESEVVLDECFSFSAQKADLFVLIGNDAVNDVTARLYLSGKIVSLDLAYGSDGYCIRSMTVDGNHCLLLAGGRPRATLYAVYRYFEAYCGCRYFWDGDRIPKGELPIADIDLTEHPRFAMRGLRYFAHRSLHRFQAEHWGLADWQTEIDWIVKKRLNFFMLRIGTDDLFQRAFPELVPYPVRDERSPEAGDGYDDRTLFWSLEHRGELRKQILQYAFERDLFHPEDCGTMTHWYSRTPKAFLEKVQPDFLPQITEGYGEETGRVWDIRQKKYMDLYAHLTDTYVKEYGKPQLFHTIGLGERLCSSDREENQRMKLFVYHKLAAWVQEHYPNAPLLIASWDLWMHFSEKEVRQLLAQLDPKQCILLDYTSDTMQENNFTKWDVLGKFPWIFGIFSAYEPNSEIRGFYELTNERLKIAKSDPMCQGMILWPELSHGDSFCIEYFTKNAWEENTLSVKEQIDRYCRDRYPAALCERMQALWRDFMPVVSLTAWSVENTYQMTGNDIFPIITYLARFEKEKAEHYRKKVAPYATQKENAISVLRQLADLPLTDEMTRRDVYDIARTVIGRYINAAILQAEVLFATDAKIEKLEAAFGIAQALLQQLCALLGSHEDFSLLASLQRLQKTAPTNPNFEATLKQNAGCGYCRSYIYENATHLYVPEMQTLFDAVRYAALTNTALNTNAVQEKCNQIQTRYFQTPLCEMQGKVVPLTEVLLTAAQTIESFQL